MSTLDAVKQSKMSVGDQVIRIDDLLYRSKVGGTQGQQLEDSIHQFIESNQIALSNRKSR